MKVVYFNRGKRNGNFSIELLFKSIQNELKGLVDLDNYFNEEDRLRILSVWDVRKCQGDVNHITGDVNYLSIGLSPSKTVLTIHDLGYFENPVHSYLKRAIYKFFWLKIPISRVKIITTVSEFTKQKILKYIDVPAEKIKVIPNPLFDIYNYHPKKISSKPIILQIGTGKHKNLNGLIEAAKGLNCRLHLIGYPTKDEIDLMTSYNLEFEVTNNLSDEEMFQAYVESDLLFFASFYEGFGLPIIEANAVGRPVITSNCAAMPGTAGNAAHIVDPSDIEQIRDGIVSIIGNSDYRNKLITNGLENAQRYSLRQVALQYYEIYQQVYSQT